MKKRPARVATMIAQLSKIEPQLREFERLVRVYEEQLMRECNAEWKRHQEKEGALFRGMRGTRLASSLGDASEYLSGVRPLSSSDGDDMRLNLRAALRILKKLSRRRDGNG